MTKDKVLDNTVLQLVIKMSLDNAETYLKDARLLINNSSFGHAFALTILALEEVGKAIYCDWARRGFIKIEKDFLKRLKTHKVKQRVLKEIDKLVILSTEIDKYKKSKRRRKYPFKSDAEMMYVITKIEEMPHFKSVDNFYESLEEMKQLALYVDIGGDGIPSTPNVFTNDICETFLDFVQKRFISVKADPFLRKNED